MTIEILARKVMTIAQRVGAPDMAKQRATPVTIMLGIRRNEEKRTDEWLTSLLKKILEVDNKTKRRKKEE